MNNQIQKATPAMFVLIILCFFLPFVTISCQNQPTATLTGIQLITDTSIGKEPSTPGFLPRPPGSPSAESSNQQRIPTNIPFALVFLFAFAGLGVSLLVKSKQTALKVLSGIGSAGSIILLFLKTQIDNEILKKGQGLLTVEYGIGFWGSFLLFLSAALLNGYLYLESNKNRTGVD